MIINIIRQIYGATLKVEGRSVSCYFVQLMLLNVHLFWFQSIMMELITPHSYTLR
jgi:hypothetical protein